MKTYRVVLSFQFHAGPIKSLSHARPRVFGMQFQFHAGPIKRPHLEYIGFA